MGLQHSDDQKKTALLGFDTKQAKLELKDIGMSSSCLFVTEEQYFSEQ